MPLAVYPFVPRVITSASAHPIRSCGFSALRKMSTETSTTRTRPANWKALAPAPLPGPTFSSQATLPSLPVPPLSDTLAKLKESLRPVAWDEKEFKQAVSAIDEFARGPADELQQRLLTRQAQTEHWLEDWWDDGAYLTYRDSVRDVSHITD